RVAVTTMASSSWAPPGWDRDSSAWLVACARAETGKASNVATYADAIRRLAMRIPSQGLPVKHESVPGYCKAGRVVSTLTHGCVNIFSLRGNRFWIRGLLLHCDNPQASGAYGMAHGTGGGRMPATPHGSDVLAGIRKAAPASAEDDGLVAVEQDAVLDMATHRARQHLRL